MAKIAYILLCHKDPDAVVAQARRLTAAGDCIAIHFDGRAPRRVFDQIAAALDGNPDVVLCRRRIRCGWGEWSLVRATLVAIEAAVLHFPDASHFYMLSGDCMPIKSAEYVHDLLDAEHCDHIESLDFFDSGWIKTGLREERLSYRHYWNERTQKGLFYAGLAAQKRLGLRRAPPADLQMMIGSQWWCLRRGTIDRVLAFCKARPEVVRFFRTTWIPDETFFQTLVRHLVPEPEIRCRSLTFLTFSDYGMPVTFYDDHYELLLRQDYLFARKISPGAQDLLRRLGDLYATTGARFEISGEGRRLHGFLTGRGRVGRRFAPRFWETESTLGRDRELMIVACKKWHIGKRLLEQLRQHTNLPACDYLFDEEATPLPDLGGIQTSLAKRTRHRRAMLRMLFDYHGTDRMVICLDPANLDLIGDFFADRSRTSLLEIDCQLSDAFLAGHAQRVGLAGARMSAAAVARLLPTLRRDLLHESDALNDAGFSPFYRLRERAAAAENARALAAFLSIPEAGALRIVQSDHLFAD